MLSETGKLPNGVTFRAGKNGTATLGGISAAGSVGTYSFTITAGNAPSSLTTQAFALTVAQAPPLPAGQPTFTVGKSGSFTITTTGYPAATLSEYGYPPSGVTFTAGSNGKATLHGTPAAGTSGTYYFYIIASNGVSLASRSSLSR